MLPEMTRGLAHSFLSNACLFFSLLNAAPTLPAKAGNHIQAANQILGGDLIQTSSENEKFMGAHITYENRTGERAAAQSVTQEAVEKFDLSERRYNN